MPATDDARPPRSRRSLLGAIMLAGLASCPIPAAAQDYPTRPIRMVVPFPAGGGTDMVARPIAQRLAESLQQTVVVDNIGGASGALGHEAVARAAPDGYTLLVATASTIGTTPLVSKVSWDPVGDFTPIAMLTLDPLPLVVHPSLPVRNVRELIALAREKPGTLTMASFGVGSVPHLAGELFNAQAGTRMLHVPYRGGAPAMNDLIGGHVSLMFNSASPVRVAVAAGQVRLIAIGAPQRSATLPDVPTIRESGLPDFEATTWIGLYGPAKLPTALVRRISERLAGIMQQAEMRERMASMGTEARSGTPEELRDILARDIARWGKLVREGNIRSE
jgi:tripartite-type tricarboxylate transporter receptor subunit TctC